MAYPVGAIRNNRAKEPSVPLAFSSLGRPYLIKGLGGYPSWDFLEIVGEGRSFLDR